MCVFCNMNHKIEENTIIDETANFYVLPSVGSLVDGYILVVSKKHIDSMSQLSDEECLEYVNLINKYRDTFKDIYGEYPIVFEHGSPILEDKMKANSVSHAHTHIVNHRYSCEDNIIRENDMTILNNIRNIKNNKNYIMYINENNKCYITYNFKSISQLMRIYIARDLKIDDKYNWREERFMENISSTILKIREYFDEKTD